MIGMCGTFLVDVWLIRQKTYHRLKQMFFSVFSPHSGPSHSGVAFDSLEGYWVLQIEEDCRRTFPTFPSSSHRSPSLMSALLRFRRLLQSLLFTHFFLSFRANIQRFPLVRTRFRELKGLSHIRTNTVFKHFSQTELQCASRSRRQRRTLGWTSTENMAVWRVGRMAPKGQRASRTSSAKLSSLKRPWFPSHATRRIKCPPHPPHPPDQIQTRMKKTETTRTSMSFFTL